MTVTVRDLIDILENEDPDAEVRLMAQPSWPFEYSLGHDLWHPPAPDGDESICAVCEDPISRMAPPRDGEWAHIVPTSFPHDPEPWDRDAFTPHGDSGSNVVYLLEGTQLGYGTKDAWG